ncbi:hypothetical protein BDW74DRAFT_180334 [Aspergillus multicolor]|uniref:uncharacterized protein n=1 Tax=Aspergillus multicolor TaxID=41759 RepID=UPI003CCE18FF
MGLEFFTSSYLQYKADTEAVATWLRLQRPRLPHSNRPDASRERLESSPKKTGVRPDSSANPDEPKHILAIKDFVSLADYIAASTTSRVRVPEGFVAVLDRAIAVRRRHGTQVAEKLASDVEAQESDERHNFFIGILEHVQQALHPLIQTNQVNDPSSQRPDDDSGRVNNLANRFERLDVQEPSKAFLQAPNVFTPTVKDDKPPVQYKAERIEDDVEIYMAFKLMIQDGTQLRRLIASSWASYRRSEFDLVAVSLMTYSAIDIAQRMEEDIQPLLDRLGGSENVLTNLYNATCKH